MAEVTEQQLREQLADCTRLMVFADLMDYSGHVSARIPGTEHILIQPRDTSRAGITAASILVMDLDGNILEGEGPAPAETAIHLGMYRARADVHAVGHAHPPLSTLFTVVDRPMIAVRNYGYRFIDTPVHPDPTHIRTLEQGAAVAATLGAGRACLLRAHGNVVVAKSVAEVFLDCLEMEENARSVLQAVALGPLKPITADEVGLLEVSFGKNDFRVAKVWEHYQDKARQAGVL